MQYKSHTTYVGHLVPEIWITGKNRHDSTSPMIDKKVKSKKYSISKTALLCSPCMTQPWINKPNYRAVSTKTLEIRVNSWFYEI